jgi:hypothetical protein
MSAVLVLAVVFAGSAMGTFTLTHGQKSQLRDPLYMGVVMRGNDTSAKENAIFPKNYYDESFRLIHDPGMNHVRYLFY